MTQLVVKLECDSTESPQEDGSRVADEIQKVLDRHAALIRQVPDGPARPGEYLYIETISGARVDALREELEGLPGVEAAYVKPMDELP